MLERQFKICCKDLSTLFSHPSTSISTQGTKNWHLQRNSRSLSILLAKGNPNLLGFISKFQKENVIGGWAVLRDEEQGRYLKQAPTALFMPLFADFLNFKFYFTNSTYLGCCRWCFMPLYSPLVSAPLTTSDLALLWPMEQ